MQLDGRLFFLSLFQIFTPNLLGFFFSFLLVCFHACLFLNNNAILVILRLETNKHLYSKEKPLMKNLQHGQLNRLPKKHNLEAVLSLLPFLFETR